MDIAFALAFVSLASLFGGMVFFPAVVAPRVFRVLPEANAGAFLRDLFPRYYMYIIVTSSLAAIGLLSYSRQLFFVMTLVTISTLAVRQVLVPLINVWRDQALEGSEAGQRRFDIGHRISVVINGLQMLAVLYVILTVSLEGLQTV